MGNPRLALFFEKDILLDKYPYSYYAHNSYFPEKGHIVNIRGKEYEALGVRRIGKPLEEELCVDVQAK